MKRLPAKGRPRYRIGHSIVRPASLVWRVETCLFLPERFLRSYGWMSRLLILLGLILVAAGLLWPWIGWLKLGRLPGDIVVERQNFSFYFPITTGLLFSAILTVILWLAQR